MKTGEPLVRNPEELLMLVVTELAEAVEGIRKNLMDDKLPHRTMEEVEMADAYIRLMDYAGGFNITLVECLPVLIPRNKASAILGITKSIVGIARREDEDQSTEVSNALAHIESYCKVNTLDLFGAIKEKMAFNGTRKDHTVAHRLSKHGKKF